MEYYKPSFSFFLTKWVLSSWVLKIGLCDQIMCICAVALYGMNYTPLEVYEPHFIQSSQNAILVLYSVRITQDEHFELSYIKFYP